MDSPKISAEQPIEFSPTPVGPQPRPLPLPPRKPDAFECCGTGCIPCVMDIYEEEFWQYEKNMKAWADAADQPI